MDTYLSDLANYELEQRIDSINCEIGVLRVNIERLDGYISTFNRLLENPEYLNQADLFLGALGYLTLDRDRYQWEIRSLETTLDKLENRH